MPDNSLLLEEISDMLADTELFRDFTPAEIRVVARYFNVSNMAENDAIFQEGDAGTFMCIIHSGKVTVLKANQNGEKVAIATLGKGRSFGEMAVLDGERRSATCMAATDCALLTLSKESLDKMLFEIPRTAAKLVRAIAVALSRRLRMADGKLVDHQI